MDYKPTIGLEIHAELKTKTKMFCNSLNDSNEKHPNVNVCPVCMGYPGTLPVINLEAVKSVLRVGLAVRGKLADYSQFDRKNYFYPDLPKGYQITQYKHPFVEGGTLNDIKITRIHLEEDTGRLVHEKDATLVDFNRAGVPLMELVTEPVISSGSEARAFAEELRLLLRYLDVSDANMEKGQMRVEVNISLLQLTNNQSQITNNQKLGTKVEVKNLNSFRSVEKAIQYEIERQTKKLEKNEKIVQETRGWDEEKQQTFSQRKKEESHDYRYFPEPDLPPLKISEIEDFSAKGGSAFGGKNLETTLPELPWDKRKRIKNEYGIKVDIVDNLVNDRKLSDFFEKCVSEASADMLNKSRQKIINTTVNYIASDLAGLMKEKMLNFDDLLVTPENFADLVEMTVKQEISSRVAKDVLREMVETGAEPHVIIEEKCLKQTSNKSFIEEASRRAIKENPKAVSDYKKGKEMSIKFLVGVVMKNTKGAVNPQKTEEILKNLLKTTL